MTLDDVKSKIAKLLQWKEGQESIGMLHLAEQAAEKVAKLMMEYNLELVDINARDNKKATMKQYIWNFMELPSSGVHTATLGIALSKSNFCDCYYTENKTKLVIYGQDFEVDVVVYLLDSLVSQIRYSALSEYRKQYNDAKKNYLEAFDREPSDKQIAENIGWINTFIRNHTIGAAQSIKNRLYNDLKNTASENKKVDALIVVKKNQLDKYLEDQGIKLKTGRANPGSRTNTGYNEGYEKGKNISMNRAINSNGITIQKQLN